MRSFTEDALLQSIAVPAINPKTRALASRDLCRSCPRAHMNSRLNHTQCSKRGIYAGDSVSAAGSNAATHVRRETAAVVVHSPCIYVGVNPLFIPLKAQVAE